MTKVADRVVLDTNVLLAATDRGRQEFSRARAALDEWPAQGTVLYTSGQIMREYLSVATRPEERNGLGLRQADAITNVRAMLERFRLLTDDEKATDRLLELLDTVKCTGKQVHDANIVAMMLSRGIDTLATINVDDFVRFDSHVRVVAL